MDSQLSRPLCPPPLEAPIPGSWPSVQSLPPVGDQWEALARLGSIFQARSSLPRLRRQGPAVPRSQARSGKGSCAERTRSGHPPHRIAPWDLHLPPALRGSSALHSTPADAGAEDRVHGAPVRGSGNPGGRTGSARGPGLTRDTEAPAGLPPVAGEGPRPTLPSRSQAGAPKGQGQGGAQL